ncbi:MAG: DUF1638 domain-containing protein [Candidatus Methanomethylophilaceae archaeon]
MRIGILGCDAIRNEIEMVTADDPDVVYREYLEFGLHMQPEDLKKAILDKLNSLPVRLDIVFLGYGYCQALKGIPDLVKIPVVMLEHEDCIAAMLTTERYNQEKKNGGITWFYPAGWSTYGMPGIVNLFHLDCMNDEGYDPKFFLDMLFDGFSRCLYIDTGCTECTEECKSNSEHFAELLDLRHESVKGSLDLIKDAWSETKSKAAEICSEKNRRNHDTV